MNGEGAEIVNFVFLQGKLQGVPVLELPTDRPYPPGGLSSAGDSVAVVVPPPTAAALRQLTSACNTTLYTTLLTAWKVGARRMGRAVPVSHCCAERSPCMHNQSTRPASNAQGGMLPHPCFAPAS